MACLFVCPPSPPLTVAHPTGLNGIDNARIRFDNVRVPVDNLLDRYGGIDGDGRYASALPNPHKRFAAIVGELVTGRLLLASTCAVGARIMHFVAVRHAFER